MHECKYECVDICMNMDTCMDECVQACIRAHVHGLPQEGNKWCHGQIVKSAVSNSEANIQIHI